MKMKEDHWTHFYTLDEVSETMDVDDATSAQLWSAIVPDDRRPEDDWDPASWKFGSPNNVALAISEGRLHMETIVAINRAYDRENGIIPKPCMYCGKPLTTRKSMKRGAGPKCSGREHLAAA